MAIPPEMLGFRGDPKWRDMSDYLVHFTDEGSMRAILDGGEIEARTQFGWFRSDAATVRLRMSACFSEIPIDQIDRLVRRHGRYGIGFTREFVQAAGGARVWYAEEPQTQLVFDAFREVRARDPRREHPLWKLTPFIDDVRADRYNFTWEREWRVPGGLRFALADVQFLMIPHGTDRTVFRNPAPGKPLLSADAMDFWAEAWSALGGAEDRFVDKFLQVYANPAEHLIWDSEDGDYVWVVPEYETEDAVADLFADLDDDAMERLSERLNQIAPSWLSRDELDHIYE